MHIFEKKLHVFVRKLHFLGEKCIFFGENAWISENQEGFALENALNFRIHI